MEEERKGRKKVGKEEEIEETSGRKGERRRKDRIGGKCSR